MPPRDLSRHEAYQVFGPTTIRKVEDQLPYLKATMTHGGNKGTTPERGMSPRGLSAGAPPQVPNGISHLEMVGLFRITVGEKESIIERVRNAPPDSQTVEVHLKAGKHVAFLKLVETVATTESLTAQEQAWRDPRSEMKIETVED